jgi:Cys-tRNA(Pro)/Cys-tRNA(Cys) deacylase
MIYAKVLKMLEESGADFQLHDHPVVTTIDEANEKVPHLTQNLLKTIVFKIKEADWILAAVNGCDRIHYKKLADAVGVKRTQLRSIAPDQVESELGFELGGVGPFAVRKDIRVVFDASLEGLGAVFCGSGRNTRTVEIDVDDLAALTNGIFYPVCKESKAA